MKVLSVIWKIPDDRLEGFADGANGLIVVRDLCEYIGRKIESYLLLGKEYLPAMKIGNIHIVDSKSVADKYINKSHLEIMILAFKKALDNINADIVHIHDCGDFCRACIKICIERKIPYVFTAHAFIGKEQKLSNVNHRDIIWQKEIYTIPNINIVAVGKGLAGKIFTEYSNLNPEQIKVIQNGTDFKADIIKKELKAELKLNGKKLLICPGTLTMRKNQLQIVRAFKILPQEVKEKIGVVFCGNDRINGMLQTEIKNAGLENSIKYVGVLSSLQMKEYYSISDGFIMASITEGLSIAALEAITYGLPLIMFSDVECAVDFDNNYISCFAKERTDKALADAIERWAYKDWNRDFILEYAKYFSMERVADEYMEYYRNILNRKG